MRFQEQKTNLGSTKSDKRHSRIWHVLLSC